MNLTPKEQEARKRVCLALDVPTIDEALNLTGELSNYVGIFKIGKQIHTSASREGIDIVDELFWKGGHTTFLDLKFHDTPNTVYGASKAVGRGVSFFNVHITGGEVMCKEAKRGAYDGAKSREMIPKVIGVTVLTSLGDDDLKKQGLGISYDDLVRKRTELAREWGLDGIVCPVNKAGGLEKEFGSDFMYLTPGIEWAGMKREGQKQLYTPDKAVQDCTNSILVIGGAITKKENKRETAYEILQSMAKYL
jgi:orotidine-5'-phosphate decarboxylase